MNTKSCRKLFYGRGGLLKMPEAIVCWQQKNPNYTGENALKKSPKMNLLFGVVYLITSDFLVESQSQ